MPHSPYTSPPYEIYWICDKLPTTQHLQASPYWLGCYEISACSIPKTARVTTVDSTFFFVSSHVLVAYLLLQSVQLMGGS